MIGDGPGRLAPSRRQQLVATVPPTAGAVVMAAGILSVDLDSLDHPVAAGVVLWFAVAAWLFLVAVVTLRWRYEPRRLAREAGSPAALTAVAGTAVLGTVVAGRDGYTLAAILFAIALLAWAVLVGPVLRHWKIPVAGASFLLTAGTETLAVLGATLAARYGAAWLLVPAIVVFLLGLIAYAVTAWHFPLRQLRTELGDEWVAGGALAICALAYVKITVAGEAVGWVTSSSHGPGDIGAVVLWCLAMAWLAPLVVAEAVRPRLTYDVRRWATVFPLGMYAACSFAVARVTGIAGIAIFARAWTWLAVGVSLIVFAGLVRRAWRVVTEIFGGGSEAAGTRVPHGCEDRDRSVKWVHGSGPNDGGAR